MRRPVGLRPTDDGRALLALLLAIVLELVEVGFQREGDHLVRVEQDRRFVIPMLLAAERGRRERPDEHRGAPDQGAAKGTTAGRRHAGRVA